MTLPRSSTGVPYWPDGHDPDRTGPRLGMPARVAIFLALFALMQGLYAVGQGTWLQRWVIDEATVKTSAWLIDWLDPGIGVQAAGSHLRAPGGGINILNGCEGVEATFLVVAAMLVAPLRWRARLAGLVAGAALVFVLNQARVLALFFAFRSDRAWFDALHGVVAPLLLVFAVAAFFLAWLDRYGAPGGRPLA